jgi:glucuronokinase
MTTAEPRGAGVALARAALAGNPSDGYGGAVLAVTLPGQEARATVEPIPAAEGPAASPPNELVEAAVQRFARRRPAARHSRVGWSTVIPRGVGLGGSSAIVIATLRALAAAHRVELPEPELATMALAVETEDLGIAAGLQDRVAQACGGLTFMEFGDLRYERLDPALLPPLVVAWRAHTAEPSGRVHGDLRSRFERGEPALREAMAELAELARSARAALYAGDHEAFMHCVDGSFDVRAGMLALDPGHVAMITAARRAGAAANYTGSGGAIVAVCRDEPHREAVRAALRHTGCGVWDR